MFFSPVGREYINKDDAIAELGWIKKHAKDVALYWLEFARDRRRFLVRGVDNGIQSI